MKIILVIEDNEQNMYLTTYLLENRGYEVMQAWNGHEGLAMAEQEKPALILLDIQLPEMDGYTVCEKIKADFSTRHIPVIFLTAKVDINDVVKGFETGGVDYVTKPFNSLELLARVRTHVEVKILRGLLPICSRCKKIRDDQGFWDRVESYLEAHSQVTFTHSICPGCLDVLYGDSDWFRKDKK